jgi:hypothetical protein
LRKCRRHYGVSVSQPFSSYKHSERDAYTDPFDGEKKARGQMTWFLKKGDAILSTEPKHASIEICRKFGLTDDKVFRTTIMACENDEAPASYADFPNGTAPTLSSRAMLISFCSYKLGRGHQL